MDRRMICETVLGTTQFQGMPQSAKLLYIYLILNADDHGMLGNPKALCRSYQIRTTMLDSLAENGYIYMFESGVIVILHWPMHSSIPPSKKRKSIFPKEAARLVYNKRGIYEVLDENAVFLQESVSINATQHNTTQPNTTQGNAKQHNLSWVEEVGEGENIPDTAAQPADFPPPPATAAKPRVEEADGPWKAEWDALPDSAPGTPTREEVMAYAREHGLTHVDTDRFYRYFSDLGWRTKTGTPVRWQLRLTDWDVKDRGKAGGKAAIHDCGSFDTDDFFTASVNQSYDSYCAMMDRAYGHG